MRKWLIRIIFIALLCVFAFSATRLVMIRLKYRTGEKTYSQAVSEFTRPAGSTAAGGREGNGTGDVTQYGLPGSVTVEPPRPDQAPIEVDFDLLISRSKNVAGWIYCEGTVINYPVMAAQRNNYYYVEHDFMGNRDFCGAIFIDYENERDFTDCNTIVYGHNMKNNTMFATLEYWEEQEYYDKHPCLWLLTPEQDYRVDVFSVCHTAADSEIYDIHPEPCAGFDEYLERAISASMIETSTEVTGQDRIVVLSTCTNVYDLERIVVFGRLTPVNSAGGVPFAA
ncbi:MAG: class B sortase [Oscillospiraceae bacterium]|nr:class B sortase [Oscillospiraceae bacterium]